MRTSVIKAAVVCALLTFAVSATAQERLVRFEGGIGATPLKAGALPNEVNDALPGGRTWVISRLTADVRVDGRISVDGRGLLLGGGAAVGTPSGQSVRARLYCGGVPHNSAALVPLEPDGDFRIEDMLIPVPPSPCANPVLLILNGAGSWFAAGIPKQ
jgi:hypothetical protein